MKNPYEIVKSRHITEKTTVLEQLQSSDNNKCVAKCSAPKYVFIVDRKASKPEIATAIESIYQKQSIKVTKVNTIQAKPKPKKRGRGRPGKTAAFKKAIVTMEPGDSIDNI